MSAEITSSKHFCHAAVRCFALLAVVFAGLAPAEIILNRRVVRSGETAAQPTAPAPVEPVLKWKNGESLAGEFLSVDASELQWKTPLFGEPLALQVASLQSIEFPKSGVEPIEAFAIELRNGDRFFGVLTALNSVDLTVRSDRYGEVLIARDEVLSVRRVRGGGVLYVGPTPGGSWRASDPNSGGRENPKRLIWKPGDDGLPKLTAWNRTNFLLLPVPELVEVDIRVKSSQMPQFKIEIVPGTGPRASLETWGDELILATGKQFQAVRTLKAESDRVVALRILIDYKTRRYIVATPEGEVLVDFHAKEDATKGGEKGIKILNTGTDLALERLIVRNWSGETPPKLAATQPRIELNDGKVVSGKILRATEASVVVAGAGETEQTIALENIASLEFAPQLAPRAEGASLWFADGAFLNGKLISIKEGIATIEVPWSRKPVTAKADSLKIVRLAPSGAKAPDEAPLDKQDRIVLGKTSLHGKLTSAGDASLHWLPVGGVHPVTVATGSDATVIRSLAAAAPAKKPRALFFLTSGDILPGDLKAMDENFVHLEAGMTGMSELPVTRFHAVQFTGPDFDPTGFKDPGWRVVKGGEKAVTITERTVKILSGGGVAHPAVMQADEIAFTLDAKQGYGALRFRMFTDDAADGTRGLPLLLMRSGNEIYCGQEERDGQFDERGQLSIAYNKSAKVRLVVHERTVEIFVNDVPLLTTPAPPDNRSGIGLLIELANVWGNGEREMTLADFSVKLNPGRVWFPAVDPEARAHSLTVPRFRRDEPPTHALLAANGDVLRGNIEAATSDRIRVRTGLETVNVPRDRVTAAIWLRPPTKDDKDKPADVMKPADDAAKSGEVDIAPPDPFGKRGVFQGQLRINGNVQLANGGLLNLELGDGEAKPAKSRRSAEPPPPPEYAEPDFKPTHWVHLRDGGRLAMVLEKFEGDKLLGRVQLLGHCEVPLDAVQSVYFKTPAPNPAMLAYRQWKLQFAPEPVLPETGGQSSPLLGTAAKDFKLPLLGGGDFSLVAEKGKVVVLDFWATWCGPCVQSLPSLIEAMGTFDSTRVKFIGVNQAEGAEQIQRFLKVREWKLVVALDAQQKIGRQFGVEGIPHTVIIGPDGKIEWVHTGFTPDAAQTAAGVVKRLLEGGQKGS